MKAARARAGSSAADVEEEEDDADADVAAVLLEALALLPTPIFAKAWVIASSMPPPAEGPGGGSSSTPRLALVPFVWLVLLSWPSWEIQLLALNTPPINIFLSW